MKTITVNFPDGSKYTTTMSEKDVAEFIEDCKKWFGLKENEYTIK